MSTEKQNEEKRQTLRLQGTLNPRPQAVTHELFQESDFFDPNDLVLRDVASGAKRESDRQPVSEGFWFIAPFVLSSPVSLGAIRIGRAGTTEARAERGPQTDGSGNGVSAGGASERTITQHPTTGRDGGAELPTAGAPSQYRTAATAEKKTALISSLPGFSLHRPVRSYWLVTKSCGGRRYNRLEESGVGRGWRSSCDGE